VGPSGNTALQPHLQEPRVSSLFEPTGSQGSNLLIARDGTSATVEVTRFRAINSGPAALSKKEYLPSRRGADRDGNTHE
jgi:hypothetical protein